MIAASGSPKTLQTILRHASAAFTLTVYGHLFDDDLEALAAALDGTRTGGKRRYSCGGRRSFRRHLAADLHR
jgi:integrase